MRAAIGMVSMTKADYSASQVVLETLQNAQTFGVMAILDDKTTRETDDQDCYPRGIMLRLDRADARWPSLRFLAKHLDWVALDGKRLHIRSPQPIGFRLTELRFLVAVAASLCESGMDCHTDVFYK
jgi:hypothetical protein